MSFQILGLGTALPECSVEQQEAAEMAVALTCQSGSEQQLLKDVYAHTGVQTRHSVVLSSSNGPRTARQSLYRHFSQSPNGPTTAERMLCYEAAAGPLAVSAASAALEEAGVGPEAIAYLVTVSCTGFAAPGFDLGLIRDLPLSPRTRRTHIGFMGCHAALNGLRVAAAFAASDPGAYVLICALELCSLHHQYLWSMDKVIANALFADGAGALVGREGPAENCTPWHLAASDSVVLPDTAEMMGWRIGDHGFVMSLSRHLPALLRSQLRPWLDGWLAANGLSVEAIGSWAVHPGGPRILDACAEAIGLGCEQLADARQVLSEYGNMSSPTLLFILERLRRRRAPLPCVVLAFGPGLTIELALIR